MRLPEADLGELEKRLWDSADNLRANSNLKASEYSMPVLGLIFLRFADNKFTLAQERLQAAQSTDGPARRRAAVTPDDYKAMGALYVPEDARYSRLLTLPEGTNIGQAITDAMKAIEQANEDLRGVLPKGYNRLSNNTLVALLRGFAAIPLNIEGDAFGKIYEYFLGKFAMSEGQKGGEFFTPTGTHSLPRGAMMPSEYNVTPTWNRPGSSEEIAHGGHRRFSLHVGYRESAGKHAQAPRLLSRGGDHLRRSALGEHLGPAPFDR